MKEAHTHLGALCKVFWPTPFLIGSDAFAVRVRPYPGINSARYHKNWRFSLVIARLSPPPRPPAGTGMDHDAGPFLRARPALRWRTVPSSAKLLLDQAAFQRPASAGGYQGEFKPRGCKIKTATPRLVRRWSMGKRRRRSFFRVRSGLGSKRPDSLSSGSVSWHFFAFFAFVALRESACSAMQCKSWSRRRLLRS